MRVKDPRVQEGFRAVPQVWERLTDWQRRRVGREAATEMRALTVLAGHEAAPLLLARRLQADGGPERVREATGWLLTRGLPQRPWCADDRCNEGQRLQWPVTACPRCAEEAELRRERRARIAAQVAAEMPEATAAEQRARREELLGAEWEAEVTEREARHAASRAQQAWEAERASTPSTP